MGLWASQMDIRCIGVFKIIDLNKYSLISLIIHQEIYNGSQQI